MTQLATEGFLGKASLKNFNQSPQKARLVVNLVRGRKVAEALDVLGVTPKKTAPVLEKLILSAVANVQQQHSDVDVDDLYIKGAWVDEGMKLGRSMPRARGSASPIIKRRSTITVVLDEQ